MKANELRIGNLFQYKNEQRIVGTIYSNFEGEPAIEVLERKDSHINVYTYTLKEIEPIPLTEEWLIKFGFEISQSNKHLFSIEAFGKSFCVLKYITDENIDEEYKHLDFKNFIFDIPSYYDEARFYGKKYVHELQNFHFALTGEELKIK
jgi:hypothetical protein